RSDHCAACRLSGRHGGRAGNDGIRACRQGCRRDATALGVGITPDEREVRMAKRPSIIDTVTNPAIAATELEASAPPVPAKPKPDVQHTSVYIPRSAYERLREIAFAERVKIHDLLMEGVDAVIERRGHGERARRASAR